MSLPSICLMHTCHEPATWFGLLITTLTGDPNEVNQTLNVRYCAECLPIMSAKIEKSSAGLMFLVDN